MARMISEEITGGQERGVDSKSLGGWVSWVGCTTASSLPKPPTDAVSSISRRAVCLDSDQLFRRDADNDNPVQCKNEKGETNSFSTSDCLNAARQLSEKGLSSASSGGCRLTLVSPKTRVQPKDVSMAALEKATRTLLKACGESKNQHGHPAASKDADEKQVAMLLSKA
ncbi:uncharacterized protein VP01_1011g9 [Puccinia sorghi]|uniref:Uncharacterized protein n=1 Tax=Puccinia sorghi TaxID=27349 RepID=A0A0L6VVF6_9BASI|nr:uncharacterized protein VP01_1011g9 [Puccinia sorghi]